MEITLTQFNRSMNKYFEKVIAGEEIIIRRKNGEKYAIRYCSPEELEGIQTESKSTEPKETE